MKVEEKSRKIDSQTSLDEATLDRIRKIARGVRWRYGDKVPESDLVAFGVLGYLESCQRRALSDPVASAIAFRRAYGAMIDGVRRWSHSFRTRYAFSRRSKCHHAADMFVTHMPNAMGSASSDLYDGWDPAVHMQAVHRVVVGEFSEARAALSQGAGALDDAVDRARHLKRLREALDSVSRQDRDLVQDSYFSERSLQDIGRTLGKSRSRMCRRHQRVLAVLRNMVCDEQISAKAGALGKQQRAG